MDYATYLGGSTSETPGGIAVDSAGVAYVTGGTFSADFPVTAGASLTSNPGTAAFFTKLAADGSSLLYSTFLAGPNGMSEGTSIAIDSGKSAYLTGMTAASFPAPAVGNVSLPAFAAKFDASGNLVYSTLLGTQMTYGLDLFAATPPQSSIAVDGAGFSYPASGSGGFFNSTIVASKVDSSGSVVYTAPVGPIASLNSRFGGVALDSSQNLYVSGVAGSLEDTAGPSPVIIPDVGTTVGAFQVLPGGTDAQESMFVQKYAQSLGAAVAVPNPRLVSFSSILQQGVSSSPRTVTLFNYGDASLTVNNISLGGANPSDFAISTNNCGSTVAIGASCTFLTTFKPTVGAGTRSATVNLSFGGGLASQTVALTGRAGTPVFQASPNPVDFGNVIVGTPSNALTLTISNPGTGPLNLLTTPVLQGQNNGDFATCLSATGHCVQNTWPTSVPAGTSFNVPMVFNPGRDRAADGAIDISDGRFRQPPDGSAARQW